MRHAVFFASGLVLSVCCATAVDAMVANAAPSRPDTPGLTRVEYFCSPGFRPGSGGTCVAVPSRAEIELFVDQPILDRPIYRHGHRRHHHRLRERY